LKTQISRKRIVELSYEATQPPHTCDDGWLKRFMESLEREDAKLAKAVKKAAADRLKELDD
jgi:hypothetical protein